MYTFKHVFFKYKDYILKDLTTNIAERKIGIIGKNGIGKTTLLQLMNKQLTPESGSIHLKGDSYFIQFDLTKYKNFTIQDLLDICSKLQSYQFKNEQRFIKALNIQPFLHTPIHSLSKGTVKKVSLLLGLLSVEPILLIDEPFESLDHETNENLVRIFKKEKRGLVIISHDISLLEQSVDQVYELSDKGLNVCANNILL